jgi:hypothetical protein
MGRWPTKGHEDAADVTIHLEFPRESRIQESECGMARSALLLLDSGFWILDSSVGRLTSPTQNPQPRPEPQSALSVAARPQPPQPPSKRHKHDC